MSSRSEWRRQVDQIAQEHGCEVELTRGSHLRLRHPSGWCVVCPATPSDKRRGLQNLRAEVKRHARVPA